MRCTVLSLLLFSLPGLVTTDQLADAAPPDNVLVVTGHGTEGKPPYRDGGTVEFLDVKLGAQVVNVVDKKRFQLPLEVRYNVTAPASILLTSRLGTEYWRLYDFASQTSGALYTNEAIDLRQPGPHVARATQAWFGTQYGPQPEPGLVGILGHAYFLIDQPDGHWLDVVNAPAYFDRPQLARQLTFTVARLNSCEPKIVEIQSSWQAGSLLRVRFAVTDAEGHSLPVVNVPSTAQYEGGSVPLQTQWTLFSEPTGWMVGTLPETVPAQLRVSGEVTFQMNDKLEKRRATRVFHQGDGKVSSARLREVTQGYRLPRTADGVIRETRAIWVGTQKELSSRANIDHLVADCRDARLNVIVPDIFVRNSLLARVELMPSVTFADDPDFDPLSYLITTAHAAGIQVHPWFCVTYRDAAFRKWFQHKYATDVSIVDSNGKQLAVGADVHRPEYRKFVTDLMIAVARKYDVDGIHLDYIRAMSNCYCDRCQAEYAKQFGKPMSNATEEDWTKWHRIAIGDIVQRTAAGVRKVRPGAIMSAAVFSNMSSGAVQGQDPARWAREGWLDLVIPMDYQMQTLAVRSNERRFLDALDQDDKLVTGLSLYMRSGTDVLSRPPELLQQQIELVRYMGIHGYCLFAHNHLSDAQRRVLSETLNREPAVPWAEVRGER